MRRERAADLELLQGSTNVYMLKIEFTREMINNNISASEYKYFSSEAAKELLISIA